MNYICIFMLKESKSPSDGVMERQGGEGGTEEEVKAEERNRGTIQFLMLIEKIIVLLEIRGNH